MWYLEPNYDEFNEDEIGAEEEQIRADCCQKIVSKLGKQVVCEGDFFEEVVDDELVCKKCLGRVNIIEQLKQKQYGRFDD